MSRVANQTKDLLAISRPFPAGESGLKQVRGDTGLPVVGHVPAIQKDPVRWARDRYDRYGSVSSLNFLGRRSILAAGPEACEQVLTNRDKAFANGPGWGAFAGPFMTRGILMLDFEEHLHHRRIMQSAFTRPRLEGYVDGMSPIIAREMAAWEPKSVFELMPQLKQLTLSIASEFFVGAQIGDEAQRIADAFVAMQYAVASPVRFRFPGNKWARGLKARRFLEDYIRSLLPQKKAGTGNDLFSALCHAETDDGFRFTDDDIVNHMIFVLFAAHDTTTITLNSVCYQLAKHPEWQHRLRAESEALGKDTLSIDDIDRLPAMDLVMKEAMRMIAPIYVMFRQTVKDTEVDGYFVPKDTFTVLLPQSTHHMEEVWPHHERFDPERFADERREDKVHRYAFMPFGGGAHKCIGMHFAGLEIKSVLHQMLLNFSWSVASDYEATFDFSQLPVPVDGLPVNLQRLKD